METVTTTNELTRCKKIIFEKPQTEKHLQERMFKMLCGICCKSIARQSIEELTDEEWIWLWELSLRHKVSPVVVSSLGECEVQIPDVIAERVDKSQRNNILKSMRYSAELARIARIFAENNIRMLGFKGVALLGVLGQNPGARHCGDMDVLLIDPKKLVVADKLLKSAGYRRVLDVDNSILANPKLMMHFNTKDLLYVHDQKGIDMELHISLFHTELLPIDIDLYYENRVEISIGNTTVPVMCREDYLIYLLLHGSFSVWHRLKWLVDIPLVSRNGKDYMDDAFYSRCESLGIQRMVLQGLSLAGQILHMPLAANIRDKLNSDAVKKMNTRYALSVLARKNSMQNSGRFSLIRYRFFVCCIYWPSMRPEFSYKSSCVRTLFVSLKDYSVLPLPVYLHWLYIPLRPVLWLMRIFKKK